MNQPSKQPGVLTPDESARSLRKLSAGINQAIRDNFKPLSPEVDRRLSVGDHQRFRDSLSTSPPVDEIDELVADIRRVESENSNQTSRL